MIKSKTPWNDQPGNASQGKVTETAASPGSGPGPQEACTFLSAAGVALYSEAPRYVEV
jgi:hypothetical protein